MTWIQTFTGKKFDFANIKADDISIEDIAHSLSNLCRFNGHCRHFYSVAEHSIHVSSCFGLPKYRLMGLMHDAGEAYTGDITRPLKQAVPAIKKYCDKIQEMIEDRYGITNIPSYQWDLCKKYDLAMLATEQKQVMADCGWEWEATKGIETYDDIQINFFSPIEVEQQFLALFYELYAKSNNV